MTAFDKKGTEMEKWFYSGTYMPDGTPITVAAYNEVQAQAFLDTGYRPVEEAGQGQKQIEKPKGRKK